MQRNTTLCNVITEKDILGKASEETFSCLSFAAFMEIVHYAYLKKPPDLQHRLVQKRTFRKVTPYQP